MFNLLSLFRRQPKRDIFTYWDGQKTVQADPLELMAKLEDDPEFNAEEHSKWLAYADKDPDAANEAANIMADAVCRAFDVKPLKDGGLTKVERWQLLARFDSYLEQLKKKLGGFPTQPLSTVATSIESSGPTTRGTSDCVSTSAGQKSAGPTSSAQEPAPF